MWLVGAAEKRDAARAEAENPALWREARRYNLPVKLALAAAHEVAPGARSARDALLVSLSPCRPGSPELWEAARAFETDLERTGRCPRVHVNPTYTLHAIDNLALSALACTLGNRAPCLGLGGAAGQAWCAVEFALERLGDGAGEEALLFAGDQDASRGAAGVALLFSAAPRPLGATGREVRVHAVERRRGGPGGARPDAAGGLARWLAALAAHGWGRFDYDIPAADGDGIDRIRVVAEVVAP